MSLIVSNLHVTGRNTDQLLLKNVISRSPGGGNENA